MADEEIAQAVMAEASSVSAESAAHDATMAAVAAQHAAESAEDIAAQTNVATAEVAIAAAEAGAALANANAARTIIEVEGDISWLKTTVETQAAEILNLREALTISNDLLAQLGANLSEVQSQIEQSTPLAVTEEVTELPATVTLVDPAAEAESPAQPAPAESKPKKRRLI
jgi:hypothetical protein